MIAKSKVKVNCERSFKCDLSTHINSAKIIYNFRMFAGAGTHVAGMGGNGQKLSGSSLRKL